MAINFCIITFQVVKIHSLITKMHDMQKRKKESSDVQRWLYILKVLIILQISSFHFPSVKSPHRATHSSAVLGRKFISTLSCFSSFSRINNKFIVVADDHHCRLSSALAIHFKTFKVNKIVRWLQKRAIWRKTRGMVCD